MGSIGWMDDQFQFINSTIMSDLSSLDPVVTDPIYSGMEGCVASVLEMVQGEYNSECDSLYTAEEMSSLLTLGQQIAHYECFLHLFEEGCTAFIPTMPRRRR